MPRLTTSSFYPENGTAAAADVNAKFSAFATATTGIDENNLRVEAVDGRNLQAPVLVHVQSQYNNYTKNLGEAAYTYESYSYGSVQEAAIAHGDGTEIVFSTPIDLEIGDVVRLDWTVTLWDIDIQDAPEALFEHKTGATRSGLGEWAFLIYPKVDITSEDLTDYESLACISTEAVVDIGAVTPGIDHGFFCNASSHYSVVPMHYFQRYAPAVDQVAIAYYADGQNTSLDVMRPRVIRGSYWFVVDAAETLYGLQLYTSGVWRLDENGQSPKWFLEDEVCTLGTVFGVSDGIQLERATLGVVIYRGV